MAARRTRRGATLLEALLAAVLVTMLVGLVGGGLWNWARQRSHVERLEGALAALKSRLELLTSLPLDRRPEPGTYRAADLAGDPDLARVVEAKDLGGGEVDFVLVVEDHPAEYPDYFFGGGERIPYLDLRRYRLRIEGGGLDLELVALK